MINIIGIILISLSWVLLLGSTINLSRTLWFSKYSSVFRKFSYPRPSDKAPLVSVMIPVRNEERNIEECLRAIMNQDYPNLEILVMDDQSTDRTAEIVSKLQKEDSRIRLYYNRSKPEGWVGKSFALNELSQYAKGEWYLFTDADVRFQPHAVPHAVSFAQDKGYQLISVRSQYVLKSFWEKVIAPLTPIIIFTNFPEDKVNDPKSPKVFASGQFILVQKETYLRMGKHERVKDSIVEDIAISRVCKKDGIRFAVIYFSDIAKVRMYNNLGEIWEGWSKNAYAAMKMYKNPELETFKIVTIIFLLHLFPFLLTIRLIIYQNFYLLFYLALFNYLANTLLNCTARAKMKNCPLYGITFPLGYTIFIGIILNSFYRTRFRKGVMWKGRKY